MKYIQIYSSKDVVVPYQWLWSMNSRTEPHRNIPAKPYPGMYSGFYYYVPAWTKTKLIRVFYDKD
jgi:hypothetical protein